METYETWTRLFELQKYYSWIVDRFHVSTQAYQFQPVAKNWTPESFETARVERLKVSGKPSQYDDLDAFVREQELMDSLVANSFLPALKLDISDNDIPAAIERIADWLEGTGGLYMLD